MNQSPMDTWPSMAQEMAQVTMAPGEYFRDWHNLAEHNREPLTPEHGSRWHAILDLFCRMGHKVADVLAWFGKPYVSDAYLDGVVFTANGHAYRDTVGTHDEWAALRERIWAECGPGENVHRTPKSPKPGYYWAERFDANGWPYHQLVPCTD